MSIWKFYFSDGVILIEVSGENKKISLENVLQFLTGTRIIAPGDETIIHIHFEKPSQDGFRRPEVSTCTGKVRTTIAEDYETVREMWREAVAAVAQLVVGFTLS